MANYFTTTEILNDVYKDRATNVYLTDTEAYNAVYNPTQRALNVNILNLADIPLNITVMSNYSALPNPTTATGKYYWVSNSQGTKWLPGSLGGTYYNSGLYFSNGATWEFMEVPYQATQQEVNGGLIYDKFLTPLTFENADKWYDIPNITKEPTGFRYPDLMSVTYDYQNRTIILSGQVEAYWRGRKIAALVDGWVSTPHPITSDNYFLYYDGTNFVWDTNPWTFDLVQISYVSKDTYAIRECHSLMPWDVHEEFHRTTGTYRKSGGDILSYTLASTTVANRRPDISSTTLADEDLVTVNSQLTSKLYTHRYLTGTDVVNFTLNSADIIQLNVNQPYYNKWNGSAWVQTLFPVNAYGAIFVLAAPVTADDRSQGYRYQFIQPQTVNTNLATIKSLTSQSVNIGNPNTISPEYNYIGKIIIRYSAGNWTLISVEKLAGTSNNSISVNGGTISQVTTTGKLLSGVGTPSNPLYTIDLNGFIDYNHSGTTQSYTTGNLKVLNDGAGIYTLKTYKPFGVTELWNTVTNQFNFADLSLGDEVTIRTDGNVTTTANNQIFGTKLSMSIGVNPYEIQVGQSYYKTIGTYPTTRFVKFYIGNTDTLNNPAELLFYSDAAATLTVTGFYISVLRRNN